MGRFFYSGSPGFSNEPNGGGYSLYIPNGWSVRVFDDNNGNGASRCFDASVANLQDHSWHNRIQSIEIHNINLCNVQPPSAPGPQVLMYRHSDCWDQVYSLGIGFHDDLSPVTNCIQIPSGWSVVVYRGDGRQIQAQCLNHDVHRLNEISWEDIIIGIDVYDYDVCQDEVIPNFVWIVYLDEGIVGDGCGSSGENEISNLDNFCSANWNDRISSFRIKKGYSIRVWQDANFGGGTTCFSSVRTTMKNDAFDNGLVIYQFTGTDIDSHISSLKVYDNPHCDGSPDMPVNARAYSTSPTAFAMTMGENNNQVIEIEWDDSAFGEHGYNIYEHTEGGQYNLIVQLGQNSTSYTHSGLVCGVTNHYLIKSYNQWGESATPILVVASYRRLFQLWAKCSKQPGFNRSNSN